VKYDKNGRFIKAAGTRGDGVLQFNTPHSMALDAQGNVYVADRGNRRIVVLDNNLNWKTAYDHVGRNMCLCISQGPHQYLYTSNSNSSNMDSRNEPITGEIYKMELDGRVVGRFGTSGRALKQFAAAHGLDCRDPNTVFVAEITSWRVQKATLRPEQMRRPPSASQE
jgi:DNA-binding beta-propeller fold protein YncE